MIHVIEVLTTQDGICFSPYAYTAMSTYSFYTCTFIFQKLEVVLHID